MANRRPGKPLLPCQQQVECIQSSRETHVNVGTAPLDTAPTQQKQKLSDQKSILDRFSNAKHALHQKATIEKQAQADHWWIKDGSNQYFISQEKKSFSVYDLDPDSSSTLRLPPLKGSNGNANAVAETYFKRGCVPLPHTLRRGTRLFPGTTVHWHRAETNQKTLICPSAPPMNWCATTKTTACLMFPMLPPGSLVAC